MSRSFLSLACLIGACSGAPDPPAAPAPAVGNDAAAEQVDLVAHCRAQPRYCLDGNLYELLGMTGEYLGRWGMFGEYDSLRVETFFGSESTLADRFQELIDAYRSSSGLSFSVTVRREDAILFESTSLGPLVSSFFTGDDPATLNPDIFLVATPEEKLRFVVGAHRRFGEAGQPLIAMANASDRIRTIAGVLEELGCTDLRRYTIIAVPSSDFVVFTPSQEVAQALGIADAVPEAALARWLDNATPVDAAPAPPADGGPSGTDVLVPVELLDALLEAEGGQER